MAQYSLWFSLLLLCVLLLQCVDEADGIFFYINQRRTNTAAIAVAMAAVLLGGAAFVKGFKNGLNIHLEYTGGNHLYDEIPLIEGYGYVDHQKPIHPPKYKDHKNIAYRRSDEKNIAYRRSSKPSKGVPNLPNVRQPGKLRSSFNNKNIRPNLNPVERYPHFSNNESNQMGTAIKNSVLIRKLRSSSNN